MTKTAPKPVDDAAIDAALYAFVVAGDTLTAGELGRLISPAGATSSRPQAFAAFGSRVGAELVERGLALRLEQAGTTTYLCTVTTPKLKIAIKRTTRKRKKYFQGALTVNDSLLMRITPPMCSEDEAYRCAVRALQELLIAHRDTTDVGSVTSPA